MGYRKVAEYPTADLALAAVMLRGPHFPKFNRADVFEGDDKECVLRLQGGTRTTYYRVQRFVGGGWMCNGKRIRVAVKDIAAAPSSIQIQETCRIRDLPEDDRQPFLKWLRGRTAPWVDGEPAWRQDGYYYGDWIRWQSERLR